MMIPSRAIAAPPNIERGGSSMPPFTKEEWHMKWETPEAVDFRFGMEITMYVANR